MSDLRNTTRGKLSDSVLEQLDERRMVSFTRLSSKLYQVSLSHIDKKHWKVQNIPLEQFTDINICTVLIFLENACKIDEDKLKN